MKKLIALALALVLTLSMAVCVFAAEDTTLNAAGNASADVKGSYSEGVAAELISVGITWNDVTYTYSVPSQVWDTDNHKYVSGGEATWTHDGDFYVEVTNDSSVAIVATVEATAVVNTVEVSLDKETLNLAVASEGTEGTSDVSTLTVGGTLSETPADGKIAKVTVTIAKAA